MKPQKHAELIKAWADGAEIEMKVSEWHWVYIHKPHWDDDIEYRIKPDIEEFRSNAPASEIFEWCNKAQTTIRQQQARINLLESDRNRTLKALQEKVSEQQQRITELTQGCVSCYEAGKLVGQQQAENKQYLDPCGNRCYWAEK